MFLHCWIALTNAPSFLRRDENEVREKAKTEAHRFMGRSLMIIEPEISL
jgi:hypothetical protein